MLIYSSSSFLFYLILFLVKSGNMVYALWEGGGVARLHFIILMSYFNDNEYI